MVSFTPYTHPQSPGQTYLPLSDEVLLMGAKSAYDQKDKTAQKIGSTYNSLFGISTYGKDAEVLSQFQQDFENQVGELSKANLRDPEITSKINSLITQYSSNPDVLNIHKRASVYANELQNKKDYESKGKQYISPAIRQAEKYYNSGVYTRDTQFNKSGFVAPDNKELDEIAKNTPEWENWITKGGYDIHQKGKAESSLYNNYLTHFINNPQWSALLSDQFEQEIEGLDLNQLINQGLDGIKQLFPYLPSDKQQEAYDDLLEGSSIQQNNPYFETAVRDKLRNDYFQNQAYMAAQAKTYVNTVDKKANDFAKSARDFQEAKELEEFKHKLDSGEITGVKGKLSELDKTIYQAVVASGKPIYDSNGNLIPASTLASENNLSYNPQESRDAIMSGKTSENQMPKKLQNVFDTINSGTALNTSESEDLQAYVNANKDALGSPGDADILNVNYSVEDGLKVITWEKDVWGRNDKYKAYVVNSQEEYDKVPKGSVFIDSTGKPTTKQ